MNTKAMEKIFDSKKSFHQKQAKLSFEEKVDHLIELQKLGLEMKRSNHKEIKSYEIVWKIK